MLSEIVDCNNLHFLDYWLTDSGHFDINQCSFASFSNVGNCEGKNCTWKQQDNWHHKKFTAMILNQSSNQNWTSYAADTSNHHCYTYRSRSIMIWKITVNNIIFFGHSYLMLVGKSSIVEALIIVIPSADISKVRMKTIPIIGVLTKTIPIADSPQVTKMISRFQSFPHQSMVNEIIAKNKT